MQKLFAVIENNKVVNIVVGLEDEVVANNPDKYIDYTNGWDFENGIDTNGYFPKPIIETKLKPGLYANSESDKLSADNLEENVD